VKRMQVTFYRKFECVPRFHYLSPTKMGARGFNQTDLMMVQQDAAGVRGVPESSYSSLKNGGQGVDDTSSECSPMQR
jgi:hypothetical protein